MKRWILVCAALGLGAVSAHATELRTYLDTYDYRKISEGHRELQFHTDLRDPERGDSYFVHQTGLEYGGSDLYTVGVYGVFTEGRGFSAARLLNRYRLSEPDVWPVDMAVQLELRDANGRKDQDRIEGVLILSRDIERFNVTANGILRLDRELRSNGDDEWDSDPALSLAGSYRADPRWVPGIELFLADDESRIVPGLYALLAPHIRLNVGVGLGLEDEADDVQLKTIVSVAF